MINLKYIKSLNPCDDRLNNYIKHHKNFKGSLVQFLNLTKITHNDKLWVFFKSIPKDQIKLVAADFAESVLHIYEKQYPNDSRPRKAIEAAKNGSAKAAYDAAFDAAYAANAAFDAKAAYDAYAADAAAYAADAAANAAYAAKAAAKAANAAAYAAPNQEKVQINIMKKYAKGVK